MNKNINIRHIAGKKSQPVQLKKRMYYYRGAYYTYEEYKQLLKEERDWN